MFPDMSTRFHFAGRTYLVRITDETVPVPRPLVSVTCLKEEGDADDWLERVQWPDDSEVSRFFGLTAQFFEAGEGANEALYALGGGR